MSHDFKKYKLLRKIVGLFGFKLIEKNFIKNMIEAENLAIKVETFVEKIVKDNKINKIIQVGSNDGVTDDYVKSIINKYNLKAILIEPSPEAFKKLKKNYNNSSNISFINKALDKENIIKKFYQVDEKFLNSYHKNIDVLSSFSKEHLVKWGVKSSHIQTINVECTNWTKIFKDYNFEDVQIVCIDTEGYDHVLIENLISETEVRPVIVFEWLNIPYIEFKKIFNILKKNNYKFMKFQKDIISYRPNIII